MPPIIWGLDLANIRPSAFKSSNMFDKRYHLRRERFVIYQLAMVFTVVGECMATYTLDRYLEWQNDAEAYQPGATLYNNNIIGVAGLTIFAGVFTATVFGTMFFFLLFWPALPESKIWSRIKYSASIFCTLVVLGAAVASTAVAATGHARLTASSSGSLADLNNNLSQKTRPPFAYKDYAFVIAWLVLFWIGWVFTVISTFYVFKAARFHLANPHIVGTYLPQSSKEDVPENHDEVKSESGPSV